MIYDPTALPTWEMDKPGPLARTEACRKRFLRLSVIRGLLIELRDEIAELLERARSNSAKDAAKIAIKAKCATIEAEIERLRNEALGLDPDFREAFDEAEIPAESMTYYELRQAGLCIRCHEPSNGKGRCDDCLMQLSLSRKKSRCNKKL